MIPSRRAGSGESSSRASSAVMRPRRVVRSGPDGTVAVRSVPRHPLDGPRSGSTRQAPKKKLVTPPTIVSTRPREVGTSTTRKVAPAGATPGGADAPAVSAVPGSDSSGPRSEVGGGVGVGVGVGRGVGLGVGFGFGAGFEVDAWVEVCLVDPLVEPLVAPLEPHASANRTVHIFLPSEPL